MERTSLIYRLRRKGQIIGSIVLPDEILCELYSRIIIKKKVNLKAPQTFNEKIQWLKIHNFANNELVIKAADKYSVREYLKDKGLDDLLVPLLGKWSRGEDINWNQLPERFVLKCNHGCAYNILCHDKNKIDKEKTIKQLNKWLKEDFGIYNIERHYSKIIPRVILCEEYLGASITDYKFFCMNGKPRYIYVSNNLINDRQAEIGFFNLDGTKMELKREDYTDLTQITLPPFYEDMKNVAEILCQDFTFVRVDFFLAKQRFYFAELTFTPSAGMMPFNPDRYDLEWGNELDISQEMRESESRKGV